MATFILNPNSTESASTDWIPVGETFHHQCLDDDNDATSYVKCDDISETFIVGFVNPIIAEGTIASIDSVRFLSSGKSSHRTNTTRCSMEFYSPSGNSDENAVYNAHRSDFTTVNGTARTTSDGSSAAWTYANIQALRIRCTDASTVEVYLSYLAMEVTYTEAVAADNATFFGANF